MKTEPTAQSCYGEDKDLKECAYINKMWPDQEFQTSKAIGRAYPYNITCAPVDYAKGGEPTTCILGSLPYYAVNVTKREHIKESLHFARKHSVRLAISGTGHDLLGRGDGFGSLEVWLRHYRNSIDFQEKFESATDCRKSGWEGSAIKIDGVWQWGDVYPVAKKNNVIAVGGGSTGPGAIGGCKLPFHIPVYGNGTSDADIDDDQGPLEVAMAQQHATTASELTKSSKPKSCSQTAPSSQSTTASTATSSEPCVAAVQAMV